MDIKQFLDNTNRYGTCYYKKDDNDCWNWQLSLSNSGYARAMCDGKMRYLHDVMYEICKGKIPDGLELDHTCRNRRCINPEHLEPVTRLENILRGNCTKLSNEQVEEIRKLVQDEPKIPIKILCIKYGVQQPIITNILRSNPARLRNTKPLVKSGERKPKATHKERQKFIERYL